MCSIAVFVNRQFLRVAQREIWVVIENLEFVAAFKMTVFIVVGLGWRLNWVGEDMALC